MVTREGETQENAIDLDNWAPSSFRPPAKSGAFVDLTLEDDDDNSNDLLVVRTGRSLPTAVNEDGDDALQLVEAMARLPTVNPPIVRLTEPTQSPPRKTHGGAILDSTTPVPIADRPSSKQVVCDERNDARATSVTVDPTTTVQTKIGGPSAAHIASMSPSHESDVPNRPPRDPPHSSPRSPRGPDPIVSEKPDSPTSKHAEPSLISKTTADSRSREATTNVQPNASLVPKEDDRGVNSAMTNASSTRMDSSINIGPIGPGRQPPARSTMRMKLFKSAPSVSAASGKLSLRSIPTPLNPAVRPTPRPRIETSSERSQEQRKTLESARRGESSSKVPLHRQLSDRKDEGSPASEDEADSSTMLRIPDPKSLIQACHVKDVDVSRQIVEECVKRHMENLSERHANAVRSFLRRSRTCFDRVVRARKRSGTRTSTFVRTIPEEVREETSPFSDMQPIEFPSGNGKSKEKVVDFTREMLNKSRFQSSVKSYFSAPVTSYRSTAIEVPFFHEYISLQNSILVENQKKLLYWPFFDDEEEADAKRSSKYEMVQLDYELPSGDRHLEIEHIEKCRIYRPYVEALLAEAGIGWEDILYWLLAPDDEIKRINNSSKDPGSVEFASPLLERKPHCEYRIENDMVQQLFDRDTKKWKAILSHLPKPSVRKLRLSALVCSVFLERHDFSLWHLARLSSTVQKHVSEVVQDSSRAAQPESEFTYRSIMCRVCQEHNCPFHGEILEEPVPVDDANPTEKNSNKATLTKAEKSKQVQTSADAIQPDDDSSDSDMEKVVNYKRTINAAPLPKNFNSEPLGESLDPPYNIEWFHVSKTPLLHERKPFYPCCHEGSCEQAQCRCFRENIACEKTCACPKSCKRRYRGCSCVKNSRLPVCGYKHNPTIKTQKCECQLLNRECDPDLCGGCGATEILDPVNRYNDEIGKDKCRNVNIQRGVQKKTLPGTSGVHGFGLYTGEDVKKDDFLGEYIGEIVGEPEADRRSTIYAYQKTCYLFTLNITQSVDSARAGNKTRFINNAPKGYTNSYPKILFCNGVVRIGIFAEKDLPADTELFFHYGYDEELTKHFLKPGQKDKKTVARSGKGGTSGSVSTSSRKALSSISGQSVAMSKKRLSTPERQAQTERARAAKAAKAAKMKRTTDPENLANKSTSLPAFVQRARKSVPSPESRTVKRTHLRGTLTTPQGLNVEEQFRYLANRSVADDDGLAVGTQNTTSSSGAMLTSQEILETDAEDGDFLLNEMEEEEEEEEGAQDESERDEYEVPVTDNEEEGVQAEVEESSDDGDGSRLRNNSGRAIRRTRTRIAMRQHRTRPIVESARNLAEAGSGRREGTWRKRKRVVMDDDDE